MGHRWKFYDAIGNIEITLPINPKEGGSPSYKKNIQTQATTAPNGNTIIFEGQDEVKTYEWSGVILEQSHYQLLVTWFEKRRQIRITDDLNRVIWVYITEFTPKRQMSYQYPWKHEYSLRALKLDIT